MSDRRTAARHPTTAPIQVSTSSERPRPAVARDVSAGGLLFESRSPFAVGDRVAVWFDAGSAAGRVVRVGIHDELFHYVTAVEFDAPLASAPRT